MTLPKIVRSDKTTKVINYKVNRSMDTARLKFNQSPDETPNGAIKIFTLPNSDTYVSGLVDVYLDGFKTDINYRLYRISVNNNYIWNSTGNW